MLNAIPRFRSKNRLPRRPNRKTRTTSPAKRRKLTSSSVMIRQHSSRTRKTSRPRSESSSRSRRKMALPDGKHSRSTPPKNLDLLVLTLMCPGADPSEPSRRARKLQAVLRSNSLKAPLHLKSKAPSQHQSSMRISLNSEQKLPSQLNKSQPLQKLLPARRTKLTLEFSALSAWVLRTVSPMLPKLLRKGKLPLNLCLPTLSRRKL